MAAERARATGRPATTEGWTTVELEVESEAVAADQLLALGGGVEVHEPASLRRRLHELAAALAERNAPPPSG